MLLLERYQQGEQVQVWRELLEHGVSVREQPYVDQAQDVVQETMKRVRYNVETLYERLLSLDYRFVEPESAFVPPSHDVEEKIAAFEKRVGRIPLAVREWFRSVGKVDFRGSHPELSSYYSTAQDLAFHPNYRPHQNNESYPYYTDPLYFPNIEEALELSEDEEAVQELESWFCVPDWHTKANVSGLVYFMRLPNGAVDGQFEYEPHQTTFVDYLRTAFMWGGFPGFDLHTAPEFEVWRKKWQVLSVYPEFPIPYETLQALSSGLQSI
ncbi:MAG: hypothetical protein JNJ78_09160 [Anaerolineae bacterium]|nr:hypothetical protein [Anaerolineae bacterium]